MDSGDLIRTTHSRATLAGFQTLLNRKYVGSPGTYNSVLKVYASTCVFSTPTNGTPCGFYSGESTCTLRYPSYEFLNGTNAGLEGCDFKHCSSVDIRDLYSRTSTVNTIDALATASNIMYAVSSQHVCPKISYVTPFSLCK